MRALRSVAVTLGCAAIAGPTAVGSAQSSTAPRRPPTVTVTVRTPLPGMVRAGRRLTVSGLVRGAPVSTRVELQSRAVSDRWRVLAGAGVSRHGAFAVRWHVPVTMAFTPLSWRVAAVKAGRVLAATPPGQSGVGPAPVYCAPAVPPAVEIPVGDGWIVGGLYDEGGAYPGIFACSDRLYVVTASNPSGVVVTSQAVAALHGYTLVVPAGHYTLNSGFCRGSAVVSAGRQAHADTICPLP